MLRDRIVTLPRAIARRAGMKWGRPQGILPFTGDVSDVPARQNAASTDMERLFYSHDGPLVHKWHHYLSIYDRHLGRFRGQPIRLLEIGVSQGGSLDLWRKYFGPEATIFGVDIEPRCAQFDGQGGKVRIGSQADPAFLRDIVAEMGGLDVVIDDGSHIASHLKASFDVLFPLLSEDGVYIAEDLQTAYWPGPYQGGYRRRSTFLEALKNVVDDMHGWYHNRRQGVRNAHRQILGVHFYDGIAVIEKRPQETPAHYRIGKPAFAKG